MPEAADLLNQRHLNRDADLLAKALRTAYPLPIEDVCAEDRFRWLLQALAHAAIGKVIGPNG